MDILLSWNGKLLTRAVNFHGEDLLSSLSKSYRDELSNLDHNSITYRRYLERKQLLSRYLPYNEELLKFIQHKANKLFKTKEHEIKTEKQYNEVFGEIHKYLPPLEYIMNVHPKICYDMFFRNVKKDDLLFGYIDSCPNGKIYTLKILSTLATKHRYLKDCDIMAFMRVEETQTEPGFRDSNGLWKVNTPLLTQVLVVENVGSSTAVLVGTRGSTTLVDNNKTQLGKASKDYLSPIIIKMPDKTLSTYDKCLEKLDSFHSSHSWKRSLDYLSKHFSLDLKCSRTLMKIDIVPKSYKPEERYKLARRCVAEGVAHFRAGENNEALEALQAALNIDKNHVDALMARGTLWANVGKFKEALEDFDLVIHLKPDHTNARRYACETILHLAESCVERGQLSEAEEKYQHCLEIDHNFAAAKEGLQRIGRPSVLRIKEKTPVQKKSIMEPFMNPEPPPPSNVSRLLSTNIPAPPIPPTPLRTIASKSPLIFTATNNALGEPPAKKQFMGPSSSVDPLQTVHRLLSTISPAPPFPPIPLKNIASKAPLTFTATNNAFGEPPVDSLQTTQIPVSPIITIKNNENSGAYIASLNPDIFAKLQELIKPSKALESRIAPTTEIVDNGNKDTGVSRGGNKEIHGIEQHAKNTVEDYNICGDYMKGNCKSGASGRNCCKTHPRYCKTYMKQGECPSGWLLCAKGPHPLICNNSLNLGICDVKGCKYLHLNKTKKGISTNKLGSVGFIMNSVKRKLDIATDESKYEWKIKKIKPKPVHRHYWRKLWQLKMARLELRSQKSIQL